ncbi:MAG: (2Fe-2S)-binding protein [Myxococcales bacterium]|nr:(2Fe-2S)-binding protein [Myxococcales bacterium]MCB9708919.1 (2Fe-2S)-binding protein [Myxococcales bacterium]
MIVCHCQRVRDCDVRLAIRKGACSKREVARACGAGKGCGGCLAVIDELLHAERPEAQSIAPSVPASPSESVPPPSA